MATLEITDKDIATVEQLHDNLLHKAGVSHELHEAYRQLIARMYESIRHEEDKIEFIKKLVEKSINKFIELKNE